MSKQYTIYSYTVMRSSTLDFQDKVPYLVAILNDNNTGRRQTEYVRGYQDGMAINIGDAVNISISEHGEKIFSLA